MKSHALAEPIKVETMGKPDSRKSPISRGFSEIVDMFPRTYELETVVCLGREFEKSKEHVYLDYEPPPDIKVSCKATYAEIKE